MAAHLANTTEDEAIGGGLEFHRPHDAFLANGGRGSVLSDGPAS